MDLVDERHRGSEAVLKVGQGHWLNHGHGFTLVSADVMNNAAVKANKAAVRTNSTAKLGATGVDTAEVMVFAMVLATAAGTTMGCVVEDKDSMTAWHAHRRACHGNPLVLR